MHQPVIQLLPSLQQHSAALALSKRDSFFRRVHRQHVPNKRHDCFARTAAVAAHPACLLLLLLPRAVEGRFRTPTHHWQNPNLVLHFFHAALQLQHPGIHRVAHQLKLEIQSGFKH
jgi:hypothetical protein